MRVRKEFSADDHLVDLEALEDHWWIWRLWKTIVDLEALEDHLDLEALEDHLDLEALEDHLDLEALEDHLVWRLWKTVWLWRTIWFWRSIFRRVIIGQCIGCMVTRDMAMVMVTRDMAMVMVTRDMAMDYGYPGYGYGYPLH